MAVTITSLGVSETSDMTIFSCLLTFSGNYPAGGQTLDFSSAIGFQSPNGRIFSPSLPGIGHIQGNCGDTFSYVPGSGLNNGKIVINTATATLEGTGAYGAEITGDTNILGIFYFPRLL